MVTSLRARDMISVLISGFFDDGEFNSVIFNNICDLQGQKVIFQGQIPKFC